MTKAELRQIFLARRKSLSPAARRAASEAISRLFFQNFDLRPVHFLHCFLPIEKFDEIDTKLIFEKIWREYPGVETIVPRVDFRTGELESLKFTPATALLENRWQIREPATNETIETNKIDVVLIPLLCFDARGARVGYGKGFYDRFLKNCRADCVKIGLSHFAPVAKIEDAGDFDVKLDFCITPQTVFHHRAK